MKEKTRQNKTTKASKEKDNTNGKQQPVSFPTPDDTLKKIAPALSG